MKTGVRHQDQSVLYGILGSTDLVVGADSRTTDARAWIRLAPSVAREYWRTARCRSEIIRLNLIWIIPAKGLMRFLFPFRGRLILTEW